MISVQATVNTPISTLLIFISLLKQAEKFDDCDIQFKLSEDFIKVSRVLCEEQIPGIKAEVAQLETDLQEAIPENVEIDMLLVPSGDTDDKLDFLAGSLLEQAQNMGAILHSLRHIAVNVESTFTKQEAIQRSLIGSVDYSVAGTSREQN